MKKEKTYTTPVLPWQHPILICRRPDFKIKLLLMENTIYLQNQADAHLSVFYFPFHFNVIQLKCG